MQQTAFMLIFLNEIVICLFLTHFINQQPKIL